jgi:hypothetical protein
LPVDADATGAAAEHDGKVVPSSVTRTSAQRQSQMTAGWATPHGLAGPSLLQPPLRRYFPQKNLWCPGQIPLPS